ncbi:MAG: efflux RND transporter periplasmic adaptor subunit [Bacteroidetes bacterium]|nr:efflux RND transporter periplasmic adaptor subunit [Bacteroidota bacterium]
MKNTLFILSLVTLISACGSKSENALEEKKAELETLTTEMNDLKETIAKVKGEIELLDTTARTNAIAVMALEINKSGYKNSFQVQGLVESDQNLLVSPEVPARILKILVKEGQHVTKGQIIANLDGSVASAQIAELEGALGLAKLNFEKTEKLWKQKIGSEMQYLQAKNQFENLQNSIKTARTQLGKYSLRSPISGTVDELMINEGEIAGGMTSGPVARIINLADIQVKANVSESYLGKLKKGQTVDLSFPSIGLTMTEKISSVSNVVDPSNRTFVIYVEPSKNLDKLKPNLLAMVTAYDFDNADAIVVPTKLVRNDGQQHFVYTIKSNGGKKTVEKRYIEIAQQFPSETVVKSGLETGDLVITEGVNSVIVGDEVKIITK